MDMGILVGLSILALMIVGLCAYAYLCGRRERKDALRRLEEPHWAYPPYEPPERQWWN